MAGLLGGTITFLLPETLGHTLPDTLADASKTSRDGGKPLWSWWSKDRLETEMERLQEEAKKLLVVADK